MHESDVLDIVTDAGFMINEDAVTEILSKKNPRLFLQNLLENLDNSVFIIDYKNVSDFSNDKYAGSESAEEIDNSEEIDNVEGFDNSKEIDYMEEIDNSKKIDYMEEIDNAGKIDKPEEIINSNISRKSFYSFDENIVEVISDVTGNSTCVGSYDIFVKYFRDRYTKISEMIRSRVNARPIESISASRNMRSFSRDESFNEMTIIGLVSEKNTTNNQHLIVVLEDPTGTFPVLFNKNDNELIEDASSLILDEVVGITGKLSGDGGILMASKIIRPDVPNIFPVRNSIDGYAVFISDVHVGSKEFMKYEWSLFIDFLNGKSENPNLVSLSEKIRYLVVAGDLVDGVGIYPSQEEDLEIKNILEQYKAAGEYFKQIPKDIHIIIGPGNHDAVRRAEPQPAFSEEIKKYFPENVTFVGNPALISLDGIRVLMYHGCSMDDMVATIKGVTYEEPTSGMVEMVKRRHLASTYGSRVIIAPESTDYMVIDEIPDIIHCGHVHTVGIDYYKNILLINSGTWQSQTDFQKKVNIKPDPAKVPIVNLRTMRAKYLDFNVHD
ncbi:MAG: DNA-directed DNA polymerase II small subunit [Methanosarcinaceae archaeon]|nr:DNA-directed DNA polymerase II small subunit [Methanosarcinaceae archaeon]